MSDIKKWITVNGNHIPIKEGQTVEEALAERFDYEDEELNVELENISDLPKKKRIYKTYWVQDEQRYYYDDYSKKYLPYSPSSSSANKEEYEKAKAEGRKVSETEYLESDFPENVEELIQNALDSIDNYYNFNYELNKFIHKNISDNLSAVINAFSEEINSAKNKLRDKIVQENNKILNTLPKLKDSSINISYEQANANGYEESSKYPYKSKEREWYTSNCQRCIIAYELRRRGYNVEADKYLGKKDTINNSYFSITSAFLDSGKYNRYETQKNGMKFSSRGALFKQVEKEMLAEGEGARFAIAWDWKNCSFGHTINAEIKDGKVMLYDAQSGTQRDFSYLVNNKDIRATTFHTYRLDNLDINAENLGGIVKWKK